MTDRTRWRAIAVLVALALAPAPLRAAEDDEDDEDSAERTLLVWAGDQARLRPDFLAVIDFDERSPRYGKVLRTVPVPPPGNVGNEPHHCGLSADRRVLACGGLLSVLSGQASMFFFDVSKPRKPRFLGSARALDSAVTDDFLPLPGGGFLVTQMGSASGGSPGRLAELSPELNVVAEYPLAPPGDGFNPHGVSARFDRNLLVTSDFLEPATTLNAVPGPIALRGALRFWDLAARAIVRTVPLPEAFGTMDVKLIPGDPRDRAVTANMFSGLVYTVDPHDGSVVQSFDCEDIVPHVEVPVRGGMVQLIALPRSGDRMIFASFQAGQVGLLDITDRSAFRQLDVVSLGVDAGPHAIGLSSDDRRLVVTDYFLDEDGFGKVHFEGDHRIHVIHVSRDRLELDPRFQVDFDTAFDFPARPHGFAMR